MTTAVCDLEPAFMQADEQGSRQMQILEGEPVAGLAGARPLAFVSTLKVNTDGTRISYHRDDPRGRRLAINNILNAMRAGRISDFERAAANDWEPVEETWRILSDHVIERDAATGKPCVTADGFLLSMTASPARAEGAVGDCDPDKWIDALRVPAAVLPGGTNGFSRWAARARSPVLAVTVDRPARRSFGIVGDIGPSDEIGEASVAMNRELNGLPGDAVPANREDAKDRFQAPRSLVIVFPGTANRAGLPLTPERVGAHAQEAFEAWGGEARLESCLVALR